MRRKITIVLAVISLTACIHTSMVNDQDLASTAQLVKEGQQIGKQIYRGNVYPDGSTNQNYYYERWVKSGENSQVAQHTTYTMESKKLVIQRSKESRSGALQRYDEVHYQKGYSGAIIIEGTKAKIIRRVNEKSEMQIEKITKPIVVGPTLFGFIQKKWGALVDGDEVDIAFALIERLETFGFTIKMKSINDKRAYFVLTPSSLLMKLFVDDLEVDFDVKTRKVIRYKGPVPQYRIEGKDFYKISAVSSYDYIN